MWFSRWLFEFLLVLQNNLLIWSTIFQRQKTNILPNLSNSKKVNYILRAYFWTKWSILLVNQIVKKEIMKLETIALIIIYRWFILLSIITHIVFINDFLVKKFPEMLKTFFLIYFVIWSIISKKRLIKIPPVSFGFSPTSHECLVFP